MKIKQLIHELNAMPQDADVLLQVFYLRGVAMASELSVALDMGMKSVTLYGYTEAKKQQLEEKGLA